MSTHKKIWYVNVYVHAWSLVSHCVVEVLTLCSLDFRCTARRNIAIARYDIDLIAVSSIMAALPAEHTCAESMRGAVDVTSLL